MSPNADLRAAIVACLGRDKPAGELVDCVSDWLPNTEVYREGDDLVIKGGTRFLIVRRIAPDRFRVSAHVAVPSTNVVDSGGGTECSLDELIGEISTLAS
jgi:hypothetical protein